MNLQTDGDKMCPNPGCEEDKVELLRIKNIRKKLEKYPSIGSLPEAERSQLQVSLQSLEKLIDEQELLAEHAEKLNLDVNSEAVAEFRAKAVEVKKAISEASQEAKFSSKMQSYLRSKLDDQHEYDKDLINAIESTDKGLEGYTEKLEQLEEYGKEVQRELSESDINSDIDQDTQNTVDGLVDPSDINEEKKEEMSKSTSNDIS